LVVHSGIRAWEPWQPFGLFGREGTATLLPYGLITWGVTACRTRSYYTTRYYTRGARGRGEGKTYRLPTEADLEAYRAAGAALEEKRRELWAEWGIDPVPDEPMPPLETLGFRVQRYGLTRWGDLFNLRQQLALITFADKVRRAHAAMLSQDADPDFARAVATYLALGIDMLAAFCKPVL